MSLLNSVYYAKDITARRTRCRARSQQITRGFRANQNTKKERNGQASRWKWIRMRIDSTAQRARHINLELNLPASFHSSPTLLSLLLYTWLRAALYAIEQVQSLVNYRSLSSASPRAETIRDHCSACASTSDAWKKIERENKKYFQRSVREKEIITVPA